jgi:8-oxo-dGTP pyrophosphatase MutT (NUDIX family)
VSVLAATKEGSLLLVRQFCPAVREEAPELPSGHVENGKSPEAGARPELAEETGYEGAKFEFLGKLTQTQGDWETSYGAFTPATRRTWIHTSTGKKVFN